MPTTTNVTNLKINELTEAQYDTAVQGGVIGANELSIITDMEDKAIQVSTMPTASATELDNIYQFVGTTDANYTNGYFYKCVSDGAVTPTYSWTQTDVQPSSGGGGLPDQTGNSGKFLTTDGTDASWSDKPFVQKDPNGRGVCISGYAQQSFVTQTNTQNIAIIGSFSSTTMSLGKNSVVIAGQTDTAPSAWGVSIGSYGAAIGKGSVALGSGARATADGAIQICTASQGDYGYSVRTNSDAETFKVGNSNGNFEIMSADGTIPADRLASTSGLADGNYRLQLTMSNGVPTLSWVAE